MLWALKGTNDVILATKKETEEEEIWEEVEVKEGQEWGEAMVVENKGFW